MIIQHRGIKLTVFYISTLRGVDLDLPSPEFVCVNSVASKSDKHTSTWVKSVCVCVLISVLNLRCILSSESEWKQGHTLTQFLKLINWEVTLDHT